MQRSCPFGDRRNKRGRCPAPSRARPLPLRAGRFSRLGWWQFLADDVHHAERVWGRALADATPLAGGLVLDQRRALRHRERARFRLASLQPGLCPVQASRHSGTQPRACSVAEHQLGAAARLRASSTAQNEFPPWRARRALRRHTTPRRPALANCGSLSWGACWDAFSHVQCAWLLCGGCCCHCRRWPTKKATSASSTPGCPSKRTDHTFFRGCATETPSLMSPSLVSAPSASGPRIPSRLSCAART